ncbi:bifunctional hydroxymethylpyrimidine kinase/phosphomethylpyrimidine kinase [Salibacterium salarium]|uniref:Hydroxymethylpyrimidine/phosphomethylpyrimidine kinase n=1 Tax=Salibacterium salarium TaxID=284579 RepID=A0A3R9P2T7_9BACI|nr:bifunctional hydroxymethylpyrimidine kinase/phosphomethylpyrimidine kinase [Salibacterium salarium]RSL29852.1 bifunctional hydroxymethylpyrimidine kinase/phosphomethylpyrimidine kinase [Salibacterium salarium]
MKEIPSVLSIAGTDPTGGAGIHADLKTFQECKAYGMAVVTSVVAQNTEGVRDVWHLPIEALEEQIKAVLEDIRPNVIKTGMIALPDMINKVADLLEGEHIPLVIDPVMVATSGDSLMEDESTSLMKKRLFPLAKVVTPNMDEAKLLTGIDIQSQADAKKAAKQLVEEMGAMAAVVKGGHFTGEATDILYYHGEFTFLTADRTDTKHTHGTGCTFSAAIAANLARGMTVKEAVSESKTYISSAISQTLGVGKGNGPVNHWGVPKENLLRQ